MMRHGSKLARRCGRDCIATLLLMVRFMGRKPTMVDRVAITLFLVCLLPSGSSFPSGMGDRRIRGPAHVLDSLPLARGTYSDRWNANERPLKQGSSVYAAGRRRVHPGMDLALTCSSDLSRRRWMVAMKDTSEQRVKKIVYGLWFVRERDEAEDIELLIGMYETEADAKAAIDRVAAKHGFVDFPDGFQIHGYELGRDGWVDGFIGD
jgi:hypothetical protein